jgi:hypothetical protein
MEVEAIVPTIGRGVWYYPTAQDFAGGFVWRREQACAALVCYVHKDGNVNLSVMDSLGRHFARQNVHMVQPGQDTLETGGFCTWMPYQIKQAEKHALDK